VLLTEVSIRRKTKFYVKSVDSDIKRHIFERAFSKKG
jgi:hypothetical protein